MHIMADNANVKWTLDLAHSHIEFKVRHLMISNVKGTFKTFDASIHTFEQDFTTAEINLTIDASSIDTRDAKRDEYLKSADFFDVENHKQITFVSGTIDHADVYGDQEVWGNITIKGISKNIELNVRFGGIITDPWGNEKAGFTVTGVINRSDFGLVWNTTLETGGIMVSEEVSISCEIELTNAGKKLMLAEVEPSASIGNIG